jgi:hypothetical protein
MVFKKVNRVFLKSEKRKAMPTMAMNTIPHFGNQPTRTFVLLSQRLGIHIYIRALAAEEWCLGLSSLPWKEGSQFR